METTRSDQPISLRGYQVDALNAITKGFADYDRQIAVKPTGAGKTILFAALARHYQPRRTLVLAHREELIQQAVDKIARATGLQAEVEMAEHKASLEAPVVVASVQTLMRESRRQRWPRDHFGLVVVDECHHTLADSYLNTLRHFDENAHVLGVTATPDRGDKKALARYYQNIAYEITLLDLIKQSWLSPIKVKTVPLRLDLRGVRTTAGDYNAEDLGHALEPYLEKIADVMAAHRHRKILVFLPLISLSQRFAAMCRQRGLPAEHVDGQSRDRPEVLERYRQGQTTLLSNAMLLTEGYDEPSIDCVVCLRPTKVRSLYSQIVGRGTRIWPGKDHLLLLDFLWLSEEHNLVRPAHLIARDSEEADEITDALDEEGDLEEAHDEVNADRTRRLRERLKFNAKRSSRIFDALEFAVGIADPGIADFVPTMPWHGDPVSPKQSDILTRSGIDAASVRCKGQASLIIDKLFLRRALGLASAKQVRWLSKLGHPSPELATFEEATVFLARKFGQAAA
ncbi:MAG: DEAD/DEAH box helicase [Chthoniobacterales bacterium]|nr:DEAD/DEAH box helicase [Chthoniobacterales bacterium]